ncbi:hypothetical protein OENI_50030 [Oenococcus oeni]|nr:hypothetical protein OENI_50030 [Oenococcus oeni]
MNKLKNTVPDLSDNAKLFAWQTPNNDQQKKFQLKLLLL